MGASAPVAPVWIHPWYKHGYSKFDEERFLANFNDLNFEYLNANPTDVNAKYNRFLVISMTLLVSMHH